MNCQRNCLTHFELSARWPGQWQFVTAHMSLSPSPFCSQKKQTLKPEVTQKRRRYIVSKLRIYVRLGSEMPSSCTLHCDAQERGYQPETLSQSLRNTVSLSSSPIHIWVCPFFASRQRGIQSFLVEKDDLTPGIPASEYDQRRRNLMESLPDKSIVVSVAAPTKYMSGSMSALTANSATPSLPCLIRYIVSLSAFNDDPEWESTNSQL